MSPRKKPRRRPAPDRRWPELPPHRRVSRAEELQLIDEATRPVYSPAVREAAREALVANNLRLAARIAAPYAARAAFAGLEPADLVQLGALGLSEAIDRFDAAFGVGFPTYAGHHARKRIRAAVRDGGLVRVPAWLQDRRAAEAAKTPGPAGDRARARMARARAAMAGAGPLEEMVGRDGAADGRDMRSAAESCRAALGRLDGRSRDVLSLRFGLDGEPMGLKEVGGRLGVCKERARQIIEKALCVLRKDDRLAEVAS